MLLFSIQTLLLDTEHEFTVSEGIWFFSYTFHSLKLYENIVSENEKTESCAKRRYYYIFIEIYYAVYLSCRK